MEKKLYLCLVNIRTSADMVVEAESVEEARKIAEELANNDKGEMTMSDLGEATVSDIQEMESPETADRKQAEENTEALKELREENENG